MQVYEVKYTDSNYCECSKLILEQSKATDRALKIVNDKLNEISNSKSLRVVTEEEYARRTDSYGTGFETTIIESKCPILIYKTRIDGNIQYRLFYITSKYNKDYASQFTVIIKTREVEE